MKISELAKEAGVTVATLKYYLRAGLLPPGTPVTTTTSLYDETHVARVRLVRALVDSAGMSIAQVHRVTQALDHPPQSWHDLLGAAQCATSPDREATGERTQRADRLVRSQGWRVSQSSPVRRELEHALEHAFSGGVDLPDESLDSYAEAAHAVAEVDVDSLPTGSPEEAITRAVVGTLLLEPVLSALRRLAQEDVSARRFTRKATSSTGRSTTTARSTRKRA